MSFGILMQKSISIENSVFIYQLEKKDPKVEQLP